jgi:ureidoglycolate hydrolase
MEQAYLPIGGRPLIHIVCPPPADLAADDLRPNLAEMRSFLLSGNDAVCMKRGCWHLNAALVDDSVYVLIGRESSTLDIARWRRGESELKESLFYDITDEASVSISALL